MTLSWVDFVLDKADNGELNSKINEVSPLMIVADLLSLTVYTAWLAVTRMCKVLHSTDDRCHILDAWPGNHPPVGIGPTITRLCNSCTTPTRDMKPENVLLGTDWRIKITDFGTARIMDDTDQSEANARADRDAKLTLP